MKIIFRPKKDRKHKFVQEQLEKPRERKGLVRNLNIAISYETK